MREEIRRRPAILILITIMVRRTGKRVMLRRVGQRHVVFYEDHLFVISGYQLIQSFLRITDDELDADVIRKPANKILHNRNLPGNCARILRIKRINAIQIGARRNQDGNDQNQFVPTDLNGINSQFDLK